ncbi:MAG: CDP-diacylglycerol--serine O-phosphatidyltransferase [Candidatus Omnitrophota bacterium]|nr:MAG: CDP-diacylglycerol--serine O-phosphatidyltransferase [Candidatus Omnitrophota bacterium]
MNYLANFITGLSLICGFASVIFSLESHFTFASWSIILSVIFDGIDGQIARRNPKPSEFGKEIDSLVDVVSFGIAPSVLGYIFIYRDFYLWATLALLIYLCCSVWRLAKYNITPKEKLAKYFYGLPTTASGGVLASFVLIFRKSQATAEIAFPAHLTELPKYVPFVFLLLVVVLALLMISRARYLNLDGLQQLFGKKTKSVLLASFLLIILSIFFKKAGTTMFSLFLLYLIFSPFVVKRLNHSE